MKKPAIAFFFRLAAILAFFFLFSKTSSSQVLPGWRHTVKNSLNSINKAKCIETDNLRNCFVLGTTSIPDSAKDIFLIKYNMLGEEVWRRLYDNPDHGDDLPIAMSMDSEGNILIAGISKDKTGNTDILVVKFSTEGVPVMDLRFDGSAHAFDTPVDIACDRLDNILVTGAETSLDSGMNMVIYRIRPDGALSWKRSYSTRMMDIGNAIQTDDSCNIYIAGNCNSAPHSSDILVQKYDSSGKEKWTVVYNGVFAENDAAACMAMDDSSQFYISGFVNHTSDRSDVPLLKINRNGEILQEKFYNGGVSDCYATGLWINKSGAFLTVNRTDYGTGTSGSLVLHYDKAGKEVQKILAPVDVVFQKFLESSGKPLILGSKLSHPESTLMPYIASPDTGSKLLWEFADSTVYGMAHMVHMKVVGDTIYFLGDDAGDATGSIEILTYAIIRENGKPKKSPANKIKSGVQKN
ncbi:MAG TPA: hypothetical protein PLU53_06250 [Bacteroidia bacterium]|nr:hypothetical protein [Bacteroidia bacterium]